jgi:hypothetical protein
MPAVKPAARWLLGAVPTPFAKQRLAGTERSTAMVGLWVGYSNAILDA